LFLKEIGLSVHDSMKFWHYYYSKEKSSSTICCNCDHKWSNKFIYSIRHSYGLEGKMINYEAHSCSKLKENQNSINDDNINCPYMTNTNLELKKLFKEYYFLNENEIDKILNNPVNNKCNSHFEILNKKNFERKIVSKPSHFYNLLVLKKL
jgi:DNA primase large subunit